MPTFNDGDEGGDIRALLNNTGNRKNNYTASARPGVGDDSADGYEIGSEWITTSGTNAGEVWVCLDNAAGAAVWEQVPVAVGEATLKTLPDEDDEFFGFDGADPIRATVAGLRNRLARQPLGTGLGTSGTVTLDITALNGTRQRIAATGNITLATANRIAGATVKLRIAAGASARTITYPAGWVPFGAALITTIPSGKVLRLTLDCDGTADTDIDAATVVQP